MIDGTGGEVLTNRALVIQDGRIEQIKPWTDDLLASLDEQSELLDVGEATLLPGLIDAHLHLTFDAASSTYYDATESKERVLLRAVDNAQAALRVGVTTVCDCGAPNDIIFSLRDAIKQGWITGPRIIASGQALTIPGEHGDLFGKLASGIAEVRQAVREQVEAGADLIKIMATGGGGDGPGRSLYTLAELQAVVAEAERLGKRVAAHCHGREGIKNALQAGVTRIEHGTFFGEKGSEFDAEIAQAIAQKGIYVCPTNVIDYRRIQASGDPTKGAPREQLNANWRKLLELGVRFVASSDAGVTDIFCDDYALIMELMVTELGMSPMQAILSGTKVAAEALGLQDEIGTLEVGKQADIIAVAGNPLEDIMALCQIKLVMLGGQVLSNSSS